ncbi:MAG: SARP family transcriptional regulator, partial [Eggerthellaceae bacterium]|nr:SARP family transcriptional regulator [Eggerthellaceae bacterium]
MRNYVNRSACQGHRPTALRSRRDFSRQRLVALLIRERGVARFIVAPSGYGKSSLVLEYADVVFSFRHVFWLDASSPCFLRDLDDGSLLQQMKESDPKAGLVVFEDVPLLDPKRAQDFSALIDDLMEGGCEVVVTCTPAADVYESLQHDRIKVRACDLLLDDDELAGVRSDPDCPEWLQASSRAAVRIPRLAWGPHDDAVRS